MDTKLLFAILSVAVLAVAYIPYLRDIFAGTTKPHAYTWLIWIITQGTATAGAFYGGGNWGAYSLIGGVAMVCVIFLLSFKYGTRNITRGDTIVLALALSAIGLWWLTNNPLLSVLMVTAIDGAGYIPTLRKTWEEPYSETPIFWLAMVVSTLLSALALGAFNWLTLPYLGALFVLNSTVFAVCTLRRKYTSKAVW